jgi:hypothetical protein
MASAWLSAALRGRARAKASLSRHVLPSTGSSLKSVFR